jgi:two-component system response regulator CpxR
VTPASAAASLAPRVLVIDDDEELCALMTEFLSSHGYEVRAASDGASGLELALTTAPDVVILDVMMPRLSGFDVLRNLRRQSLVPVLVLSARTAPEDRIQGLNVGADDYLLKPFVVGELLARIKAILRRGRPEARGTLGIGSLRVDVPSRRAWVDARELALTTTEFDLLQLLIETPGTIVSRDTIARALHGRDTTAYERAIDVHVSHLRKKIADAPHVRIKTARGTGYVLVKEE